MREPVKHYMGQTDNCLEEIIFYTETKFIFIATDSENFH